MKPNPLLSSCLLAALLGTMSALTAAQVTPTFDPAIRAAMQSFLESKEIAGAVTLVATPRTILHLDTVGYADVAGNRSMTADTLFWIASMTKPITGVAIMMLQDAGQLSIKTGFTEGNGWGMGWCVVREPQGVTAMLSPGSHGHGGA